VERRRERAAAQLEQPRIDFCASRAERLAHPAVRLRPEPEHRIAGPVLDGEPGHADDRNPPGRFADGRKGYARGDRRRDRRCTMQLQVKARNLELSDSLRDYAQRKLGKLDKQVHELTRVELELAVERNPSIAANQVAEATVWLKGHTLRARE